jgi:hypothetical protein
MADLLCLSRARGGFSAARRRALARDWARRSVARLIRVGGRVEAVGTMRLRFWWIVAAEEAIRFVSWSVVDPLLGYLV